MNTCVGGPDLPEKKRGKKFFSVREPVLNGLTTSQRERHLMLEKTLREAYDGPSVPVDASFWREIEGEV